MSREQILRALAATLLGTAMACSGNRPPVTPSAQNPGGPAGAPASRGVGAAPEQPPPPPAPRVENVAPPAPVRPDITADPLTSMSLDDLNRASALKPVFFVVDSDELDDAARQILVENALVLKKYTAWIVTIEGHCDERGSAEYNLALGERRALAARTYVLSLGVPAERVRTISYGNEFPFAAGHDEQAWAKNRRAQFVVTAR
jgi:peptidoglycan-associated lipoprotein